jgi:hypothetical protein
LLVPSILYQLSGTFKFVILNNQNEICGIPASSTTAQCGLQLSILMNSMPRDLGVGRLYLGSPARTSDNLDDNNGDPYTLEKRIIGAGQSALRLTLNDDFDESLEIWSSSCKGSGCVKVPSLRHQFTANGDAQCTGRLSANTICLGQVCLNGKSLATLNRAVKDRLNIWRTGS